jgi:hypothetical protein
MIAARDKRTIGKSNRFDQNFKLRGDGAGAYNSGSTRQQVPGNTFSFEREAVNVRVTAERSTQNAAERT